MSDLILKGESKSDNNSLRSMPRTSSLDVLNSPLNVLDTKQDTLVLLPEHLSNQARCPYDTIGHFLKAFNLTQDKQNLWRLSEYIIGEIHGLPSTYGRLVATNGILCYIRRSNGSMMQGHIAWFLPDEEHKESVVNFSRMQDNTKSYGMKKRRPLAFDLRLKDVLDEYC